MAVNEHLTNRVREVLAARPRVTEKRMFSGIAFMVNGKMCVTVADDRIMLRVDPALHSSLIEQRGCQTMTMRDREYRGLSGIHLVKEDVLRTKKDLTRWIQLALDFNKFAKASKKR